MKELPSWSPFWKAHIFIGDIWHFVYQIFRQDNIRSYVLSKKLFLVSGQRIAKICSLKVSGYHISTPKLVHPYFRYLILMRVFVHHPSFLGWTNMHHIYQPSRNLYGHSMVWKEILSLGVLLTHTACIWFWMAKDVGVASDGNFSSYLISKSWYNHFRSFSMGGNGNNTIYPLLST